MSRAGQIMISHLNGTSERMPRAEPNARVFTNNKRAGCAYFIVRGREMVIERYVSPGYRENLLLFVCNPSRQSPLYIERRQLN
jgi:hypothetical protein